jgi:hypothetical protein
MTRIPASFRSPGWNLSARRRHSKTAGVDRPDEDGKLSECFLSPQIETKLSASTRCDDARALDLAVELGRTTGSGDRSPFPVGG